MENTNAGGNMDGNANGTYWITIADTVCGMKKSALRLAGLSKADLGIKLIGYDEGKNTLNVALVGDPYVDVNSAMGSFNFSIVPLAHAAIEGFKSGFIPKMFLDYHNAADENAAVAVQSFELLPKEADRAGRKYFHEGIDLEELAADEKPTNYLIFDQTAISERERNFTMREIFNLYNSLKGEFVFPSEIKILGADNPALFNEISQTAYLSGLPYAIASNNNGNYGREEAIAFFGADLKGNSSNKAKLKRLLNNNESLKALCMASETELSNEDGHLITIVPEYWIFVRAANVAGFAKELSDDAYHAGDVDSSKRYSGMVNGIKNALKEAAHHCDVPRPVAKEALAGYGIKL